MFDEKLGAAQLRYYSPPSVVLPQLETFHYHRSHDDDCESHSGSVYEEEESGQVDQEE